MRRGRTSALCLAFALAAPLPAGAERERPPVGAALAQVHEMEQEAGAEAEEPSFPRVVGSEALRIWLESRFAPQADFGDADLSLVKPGARLRLRMPIGTRASVQLTGGFAANHYDVDGESELFAGCPECPVPDEFYASSIGVQGAWLLNPDGYLFRDGESWALLGSGFGRARWESGAFDDGLTGGGALGFGYELPDRLRIALAVRVESSLDGGSVSVSPAGSFRWQITRELRLRSRGLGAQLEYRPIRSLELFATGFRASDRFRLHERSNLPDEAVFRDRQWLVGGGFVWKLVRALRLVVEAGAIVDRQISLRARGEGTLDSRHGETSPYAELRIEIRP